MFLDPVHGPCWKSMKPGSERESSLPGRRSTWHLVPGTTRPARQRAGTVSCEEARTGRVFVKSILSPPPVAWKNFGRTGGVYFFSTSHGRPWRFGWVRPTAGFPRERPRKGQDPLPPRLGFDAGGRPCGVARRPLVYVGERKQGSDLPAASHGVYDFASTPRI